MNPRRPSATPSIKARTKATGVHGTDGRAISAGQIENVPGQVSIVRLQKEKSRDRRDDMIGVLHAVTIDIGKIDILLVLLSTDHCRQSRLNFCRAFPLSRTSLRRSNPVQWHIRCSLSRGCFWKKRPVTMFN
jgi:hypothetical protein